MMEKVGEAMKAPKASFPGMPKEKDSEPAAPGGDLEDAMSDLKEALDDGDFTAAAAAFRRASTVCGGEYEDDSDEE